MFYGSLEQVKGKKNWCPFKATALTGKYNLLCKKAGQTLPINTMPRKNMNLPFYTPYVQGGYFMADQC